MRSHFVAVRGGIKKAILPRGNEKDLSEIPAKIKNSLTIHFVERMDTVILLKVDLYQKTQDCFVEMLRMRRLKRCQERVAGRGYRHAQL